VKTAILGGSFNPVHNGHLALAENVMKLGYERVLFIPASRSPLKGIINGASDEDRLFMLELALADMPRAEIWDGELHRGGVSYSIDTVKELIKTGYSDSRMALILGDDLAGGFSSWKNVEELVKTVDIILARRSVNPISAFAYPCVKLDNKLWPYSSTEIRNQILKNGNLRDMLPGDVVDYIARNALYGHAQT